MRWSPVLALGLVHLCAAKPLSRRWGDFLEKHSWEETPKGWKVHSVPSPDHEFEMTIGLKQDKEDELIKNLYEVSDPHHHRYGQHLSKEEVEALVAPHPDTVDIVEEWLTFHGVNLDDAVRKIGGSWLTIKVTVSQAEHMLGNKYNVYHHPRSSDYVVRSLSYALPRDLHEHIKVITPTTYFSTFRSMKATSFLQPEIKPLSKVDAAPPSTDATVPSSCANTITPTCLRALYNTSSYVPAATSINSLGVAGYLQEFANRADLQTFLRRFRSDAVGASFTTILVNGGGDDQSNPGVEANLDIQYTVGMSFPTPNVYYSTGGSPPFIPDDQTPTNTNEPYLNWLNAVLANSSIPQTISTSYGDDEQTVPSDYAQSVCSLFAQLGTRGTTVFFSSGDNGVGGGDCKTNDGKNTTLFQPNFPASCPFVTTVGGTTGINPEKAVSFSGGGFSRLFAQPAYQSAAVTTFLNSLGSKFAGLFNATGRAYPDVAAQGSGFQVVIGGTVNSVGGTSASSPTVAGVFALLNDFRLANNKSSLGFINPLIYSNPSAFNDIKSGSNPGCGTTGFTAGSGWDPVTGLGTPNFLKLQPVVNAA